MNVRTMVILSSGALALAACTNASDNANDKAPRHGPIIGKPASVDPSEVANGDIPDTRSDGYPFNPIHDVLVFVRFNPDGSHTARVHYFTVGTTGNDAAKTAERLLPAIVSLKNNIQSKPSGSLNADPPFSATRPLRNLGNLHFSGQSNVIVFVDNSGIGYDQRPLFFTKKLKTNDPARENKAFYDSDIADINVSGERRKVLYFRNYFTIGNEDTPNPGTTPIPQNNEKYLYSFNFNLRSRSTDGGASEQMIFDPDGGNMGSGGPPP